MVQRKRLRTLLREFIHPPTAAPSLKPPRYVKIPYLGPSSQKLCSELRRFGFKAAFYPVRTTSNLISLKDPTPPLKKSGIYKASCEDCGAVYFGQTGRSFRTRIMEHLNEYHKAIKATRNTKRPESAIADHSIEEAHSIDRISFSLIHPSTKGASMNRLEETYTVKAICNNEKVINDTEFFSNPFLAYYLHNSNTL